ncbi:MAG: uracil-DNA glycosylase [Chloroflexota bacterium]|nr:uracil-DNA glycosylase [Chloroflexota bacterium]
MNSEEILRDLAAQINTCQKCPLAKSRKNAVPGKGPANAEIMLIGEGPGFHENEQGVPFVGQAGKFLDELLAAGGFEREKVFITNVVKCRPPGNRDPQPIELEACGNYLEQQIEAINPLIIVTLGRFSMARYFKDVRISHIHGQAAWIGNRFIIPMYHPAAALHQPNIKPTILDDFRQLSTLVEKARKSASAHTDKPESEDEDNATQLSFF